MKRRNRYESTFIFIQRFHVFDLCRWRAALIPHKGLCLLGLPWNQTEHRYCSGCSDISLLSMGLVLSSCSGTGFSSLPWDMVEHMDLQLYQMLWLHWLYLLSKFVKENLHVCWSQMWCCAFCGMVFQLCCCLNVTVAIEIWCLDRSDFFSFWKHGQKSIQVTKVRSVNLWIVIESHERKYYR